MSHLLSKGNIKAAMDDVGGPKRADATWRLVHGVSWHLMTSHGGHPAYLPCGVHTLPDAEEAHQPDEQQAEGQVPLERAGVVNPRGQAQHVAPGSKHRARSELPGS